MTAGEVVAGLLRVRVPAAKVFLAEQSVPAATLADDPCFASLGRPAPEAVLHPEILARRAVAAGSASSFQKASERVVALRQFSKAGEAKAAAYGAEVHVFVDS